MLDPEVLRRRYFAEYVTWKVLEITPPRFRYVQEPVYSLSIYEENIIEFLHLHGLKFEIQPRYTPDRFINLTVSLNGRSQKVKLDCTSSLQSICTFITQRSPFAEEFKGWLDRSIGIERFDKTKYTATKRNISYPYALPVYESLYHKISPDSPLNFPDSRHASYFFNFNKKETEFLNLLEDTVNSETQEKIITVKVYPRSSDTGSIELVISNLEYNQPVRVFSSGSHPVTYQIITEHTPLAEDFKIYLNKAMGEKSLDEKNCRVNGKMLSLIYTHRSPKSIENLFEDD